MGEYLSSTAPPPLQPPEKTPALAPFNESPSFGKITLATEETLVDLAVMLTDGCRKAAAPATKIYDQGEGRSFYIPPSTGARTPYSYNGNFCPKVAFSKYPNLCSAGSQNSRLKYS